MRTRPLDRIEIIIPLIACAMLIIALNLLLSGCSTVQVPHDVNMAVKTDCHPDKIPEPVWATTAMTVDTDIYDQVKMVMAERKQRQDYEALLLAAAEACQ